MSPQVIVPQAFDPSIGNDAPPLVEERPRDYVTLLHNIAHSNRWSFHWVSTSRGRHLL